MKDDIMNAEKIFINGNIYTMNGKIIRDHDNIESKKILDIITGYLLVDDTGLLCSNFYTIQLNAKYLFPF